MAGGVVVRHGALLGPGSSAAADLDGQRGVCHWDGCGHVVGDLCDGRVAGDLLEDAGDLEMVVSSVGRGEAVVDRPAHEDVGEAIVTRIGLFDQAGLERRFE